MDDQQELFEDDVFGEEQADGSMIISLDDQPLIPPEFDDNLAEQLDEKFLTNLSNSLLESIDTDKKARKRRDEVYEEGIRRTGLGDDAPGGAKFNGASKVVHPVMAESCIDFAARAIKELFPAGGPVKMETDGLLSAEQEGQVKKIAACLNNQFVYKIPEYRSVYEQELTQLPLGGSQYVKFSVNDTDEKIDVEFVPIDDIFIPFDAPSFYAAQRVTHRQYVTQETYEERIENATYRDLRVVKALTEPDRSDTSIANDKVEGRESSGTNEDGTRTIYEVYTKLSIDKDDFSFGKKSPYIVAIDEVEQKIVSIRRNWDQNDPARRRLDWIVEDMFIPWRGAQGIGLPHLIGGLSAAATGSLRALLDSAHINNAPTLLKLKGSRINGTSQSVAVTQIADIEGPVGIDDIRKYIMPMPFNAPSQVLMQLLGWLTDAAKGVVSTASEKIADATSNTPVGTVQALIEQGAVIFSSIHARLHFSQAKKFEIVLRLLKTYFPEELQKYGLDPQSVSMEGIHPVSDPRIFSEAQRFAQAQGVLQMVEKAPPGLYNPEGIREAHRSMLSLMKVQNVDKILPPAPPPPQPTDPAKEMQALISGQPIVCGPEQNHAAHIQIHLNYLKNPLGGKNPIMISITTKILDHLRDHIGHFNVQRLSSAMQMMQPQPPQMPGVGGMPGQAPQVPPQAIESAMVGVSEKMFQQDAQFASEALTIIEEIDQFVKSHAMAGDPNLIAIQEQSKVQMAEIDRKYDKDRQDAELAIQREDNLRTLEAFEKKMQEMSADREYQLKLAELQQTQLNDKITSIVDMMKNEHDNAQKQMTELLKNHDDNRTKLLIEHMVASMAKVQKVDEPIDDISYIKSLEGLIE